METKTKSPGIIQLINGIMISQVPSYANKFFYSLGFLSLICFILLVITGAIMVFFGPDWWLTTSLGVFLRSIHVWSLQAFIVFIILHGLIVFFTSAYRPPRRLMWALGGMVFFLVLAEAEFGYALRNDFSSQWRTLQGADFYNGSGLGRFINNLNYAQIYGIHVVIIPVIILGLLFLHYGLVRMRGIATPYRKEIPYRMVKANHAILFIRGAVLTAVILSLAVIFPSPLIAPISIKQIANDDPSIMAGTLIGELEHSSDTATYSDNIDPYQYDTKTVYIDYPYVQYITTNQQVNLLANFSSEDKNTQVKNIKEAKDYFANKGNITTDPGGSNPLIPVISSLVLMGQSGLYEASLLNESDVHFNPTYTLRFLSDTGVLEEQAGKLGITTEQMGMLREEKGILPPGAWWLAPIGIMNKTILINDENGDRDAAEILGVLMLIFIAFPYIPFVNKLPDKLGLYKFIWKDAATKTS